ncbi:MAG: prepilin-type N-terminal cleavage/methylation domain-containing protein [Phycisphaerae bacterium]
MRERAIQAARTERRGRRGVSIIELLVVIVVLGVLAVLALSTVDDSRTRARAAADRFATDVQFAQSMAVARPDLGCVVKVSTPLQKYWLARTASVTTPMNNPLTQQPYEARFGVSDTPELRFVSIASASLGGDDELRFDAAGAPDQSTMARVIFVAGRCAFAVSVVPVTGVATVSETDPPTTGVTGGATLGGS